MNCPHFFYKNPVYKKQYLETLKPKKQVLDFHNDKTLWLCLKRDVKKLQVLFTPVVLALGGGNQFLKARVLHDDWLGAIDDVSPQGICGDFEM